MWWRQPLFHNLRCLFLGVGWFVSRIRLRVWLFLILYCWTWCCLLWCFCFCRKTRKKPKHMFLLLTFEWFIKLIYVFSVHSVLSVQLFRLRTDQSSFCVQISSYCPAPRICCLFFRKRKTADSQSEKTNSAEGHLFAEFDWLSICFTQKKKF